MKADRRQVPRPTEASQARSDGHGLRQYYLQSTDYRDMLMRRGDDSYLRFAELVAKYVPAGASVLEVGSGTGHAARHLSARGFQVTASDFSPLFLAAADSPGLASRVAADGERLPFEDSSVDAAVCVETLEHIVNVARFLDEARRVVRVGGWVVLQSPQLASPLWPVIDLPDLILGRSSRSPHYSNLQQAAAFFCHNLWRTARLAMTQRPSFMARRPDLTLTGGDSDAVYWTSARELQLYFEAAVDRVHQTVESRGGLTKSALVARFAPWLCLTIACVAQRDV